MRSTCTRCDQPVVGHINGTWMHAPESKPGPCPVPELPDDAPEVTPEQFLQWLITMDDPDDKIGKADRQQITLTKIINRARRVLAAKEDP